MAPQHATLELNIRGMDCSGCARKIEVIAAALAGVTKATTVLADLKLVVLYDPAKTTPDEIRRGIETSGYAIIAEGDEEPIVPECDIQPPQANNPVGHRVQLRIENMGDFD